MADESLSSVLVPRFELIQEQLTLLENSVNNIFRRMRIIEDYHQEDVSMRKLLRDVQHTIDKKIGELEKAFNGYHISDHGFIEKDGEHHALNPLFYEEPYLTLTEEECKTIVSVLYSRNGERFECNVLTELLRKDDYCGFLKHLAETGSP